MAAVVYSVGSVAALGKRGRMGPFQHSERFVHLYLPRTLLFSLLRSERRKKFSLSKGLARNPSLNVYKIAISSEASRRFGNTGKRDLFA